MLAMARDMLAVGEANPTLAAIFKDAGRYVAAMCAAALQQELITLPRLQDLCAGFGVLSRGRVYALLQYLRYLGFVRLWGEPSANGPAGYAVASQFLDSWKQHLRTALMAAGEVDSFAIDAAAQLDEKKFFAQFCASQMQNLRTFSQKTDQSSAIFTVFLNRLGGSQILWLLIAQSGQEDTPTGVSRVTPASLARQFNVSRMHVGRLLRDAECEGLIERNEMGTFQLTPTAKPQLRVFYGWQVGLLLVTAARSHADFQ